MQGFRRSEVAVTKTPFVRRNVTPLTDDQIKLLQAFIEDTKRGEYDAMDLIPEAYRQYFSPPQVHGGQFSLAVEQGKLKGVEPRGMDLNSKHMRYAVHGGLPQI